MKKTLDFLKGQAVLCISAVVAIATCFVVFPDKKYADYVDFDVLILLFCLMGAVQGLSKGGVFDFVSKKLTKSSNARRLCFLLMNACFFSSMLITNDVALITFVPLAVMIFKGKSKAKDLIFTVVIQTVSANLGSMLTPIGNPQNLYLYSHYNLTMGVFLKTLLPVGILSYAMLCVMCFFVSKDSFEATQTAEIPIDKVKISAFVVIFLVSILTVMRVVPHLWCFVISIAIILVVDRKVLLKIDYPLLLTFVCFFVFVGNMGRIDAVTEFVSSLLKDREILVSAGISQVISNVPAAVMLSQFTQKSAELLMGVNIGGLGTPVASLASLISMKLYSKSENAKNGRYMGVFTAVNFVFLAVLLCFAIFL
ncbi:MAG: citrate transporter [Oscillospiraceae bacterium]|nr:citrate transporter [Oscillospiraceae bacterium]